MELEQREGTMAAVGFEEFSAPPGSELALPPLFGGHILESELETEVEFVSGGLGGSGLRERDEEEEAARGRRRRQRELNRRKYQALGRRCREIEQMEFRSCCPGWSAMLQSQLTATSASWVQVVTKVAPPALTSSMSDSLVFTKHFSLFKVINSANVHGGGTTCQALVKARDVGTSRCHFSAHALAGEAVSQQNKQRGGEAASCLLR
ncbi:TCF3 fusion partner isoform X4 [Pan paniscus]|uniref:TCF3 fusion partner isoform X4 n=1 Tax=Pan paniscus TaxID=9597 RepID=UPI002436A1CA|nr:TCF3 fusion partner isoform X4 [Pan paniscus]